VYKSDWTQNSDPKKYPSTPFCLSHRLLQMITKLTNHN